MADKLMEAQWKNYEEKVLPEEVGWAQRENTRAAFYAGGVALMTEMYRMMKGSPKPSGDAVQKMTDLQKELEDWMDEQRRESTLRCKN